MSSNFGKLNYYLGKRAADEGRDAPYPKIDFCKVNVVFGINKFVIIFKTHSLHCTTIFILVQDPEVICSSEEFQELKWIAGLFYWMESVQSYDVRGWNYLEKLHAFVDSGFSDAAFINSVSGIVNRGCHDPPCGTGELDGGPERAGNFDKVLKILNIIA